MCFRPWVIHFKPQALRQTILYNSQDEPMSADGLLPSTNEKIHSEHANITPSLCCVIRLFIRQHGFGGGGVGGILRAHNFFSLLLSFSSSLLSELYVRGPTFAIFFSLSYETLIIHTFTRAFFSFAIVFDFVLSCLRGDY